MTESPDTAGKDFIRQRITRDRAAGKNDGKVITRFPPEPNGYLHIGHAKSICLNFSVAMENDGETYLRFDDTNPVKENQAFVDAMIEDVRWLGFDWGDRLTHASDYFQQIFDCAVQLIEGGRAYVDSLSAEQIREYRGTLTEPGRDSPYRDRSVDENKALLEKMRQGEFADGEHVLRAKIDMASPNINLRDPALYRIRRVSHQRTGSAWCIYPMYDFAHTVSDALEGITHSLCTLEFEDHRPLYDWILDQLELPGRPQQIEFSRLNLAFTVTSKRKLTQLVEENHVSGWDDPRMPTIAGMRRRGYPAAAIRDLCERVGVTKKDNVIQMSVLENSVREILNESAPRALAVLDPVKIVLTNYPKDKNEQLVAANHPAREELGVRELPFGRELYIERADFMEEPPKKFFRLKPGGEVRLRYAYIIKCDEVVRDPSGKITELRCTYDPDTRSGSGGEQRKVKGIIHWVSAAHAKKVSVRLYDRLFTTANPGASAESSLAADLNPASLIEMSDARVELALGAAKAGERFQFERLGYFSVDPADSVDGQPVFNRIVTLRDTWAKIEKAQAS